MSDVNPFEGSQDLPEDEFPTAADERGGYVPPSPDEVPAGSAKEVLAWVGDDSDRAREALDVEKSKREPRKGLTHDLEALLD